MNKETLCLPSSAFPFHFVLDSTLCFCQYGHSLPRALPGIAIGQPLSQHLAQVRPGYGLDFHLFYPGAPEQQRLFVFRTISNGLLLRGQILRLPDTEQLIFLGSPWLNEPSQLEKYGLSLSDFAIHDATTDLLQVIQDLKMALQETRELSEQQKKQRAILQGILKTASDAIITTTQSGLIESFNPAAQAMFGWRDKDVINRNISILVASPFKEMHDQFMQHGLQRVKEATFGQRREVLAEKSNGETFAAELSLSAFQIGEEWHFTGIIRDISERKSQQAALAAARQRELSMGHQIQQALLFGAPIQVKGVEISAFTQPSQGIDGDFFDFFSLGPRHFDILTGDVMGKGVVAAMIGAAIKTQYNRSMAELLMQQRGALPSAADIINLLHQKVTAELHRLESFVSLTYMRVDLAAQRIEFINAGHPEGLLFKAQGEVLQLTGDNLPLGIDSQENYRTASMPFMPGDFLLLFSDGVTESRTTTFELLGSEPIQALAGTLHAAGMPPAIILQRIRQMVDIHEKSYERADDFTAIGVHYHAQPAPRFHEFPRDLAILTPLREWVRSELATRLYNIDAIELAVVEVATNIIRHVAAPLADTPFVMHILEDTAQINLDFFYVGEAFDPTKVPPPDFSGAQEGGFGLFIIPHRVDSVIYQNPAEQVNHIRLGVHKPSVQPG